MAAPKKIFVFRNGNTRWSMPFAINSRSVKSFDAFLNQISELLGAEFGTAKLIYSASTYLPVTLVSDFEHGESYVAVARGPLKKLSYEIRDAHHNNLKPPLPRKSSRPSTLIQMKQIFVVPSGSRSKGHGTSLILTHQDLLSLERVLGLICSRLSLKREKLPTIGDEAKLYSLNKKLIASPDMLEDGGVYVFVKDGPLRIPRLSMFEKPSMVDIRARSLPQIELGSQKTFSQKGPLQKQKNAKKAKSLHSISVLEREKEQEEEDLEIGLPPLVPRDTTRNATHLSNSNGDIFQSSAQGLLLPPLESLYGAEEVYEELIDELFFECLHEAMVSLRHALDSLCVASEEFCRAAPYSFADELIQPILDDAAKSSSLEGTILRQKYSGIYELARRSILVHWENYVLSFSALLILLDIFPRLMFAGSSRMFESDELALAVVRRGFESGIVSDLPLEHHVYVCLVLSHQEDHECQKICLDHWSSVLALVSDLRSPLHAFTHVFHLNNHTITKFGRFPERNHILKRPNSDAEEKYLSTKLPPLANISPARKTSKLSISNSSNSIENNPYP